MRPNQANTDDKRTGILYKWVGSPEDIFIVKKLDRPYHGRKYMSAVVTQGGSERPHSSAFHPTVKQALEWIEPAIERFIRKGSWR